MANEFTRITHAAPSLVNINPNKTTTGVIPGLIILGAGAENNISYLPVCNYKNLSLYTPSTVVTISVKWAYDDGTESSTIGTLTSETWSDFVIPSNAICAVITCVYTQNTKVMTYYSLTN